MHKSRYKKGETVEIERGKKIVQAVVKRVIDNHMIPIFQYSFEAPYDGFACGEQSVRKVGADRFPTLGECMRDTTNETKIRMNTITSSLRHSIDLKDTEQGDVSNVIPGGLFFKPGLKMVDWIKEYANGRLIMDVGAGQGHLVRMLKMRGAKAMGLEPNLDKTQWIKFRMNLDKGNIDINEMMAMTVGQAKNIIKGLGNNVLLVFARPCHTDFVEEGIRNLVKGQEALYITLPENINKYQDLGKFDKDKVLLNHNGKSEDNEVIYSIIR